MEGRSLGVSLQHVMPKNITDTISQNSLEEIQQWRSNWYLSEKEIDDHSPSRKDGIDLRKESRLRKLYCSFLHDLGMKLKVPQFTIATSTMFCHRFYMRQSHAKNDWQTIATVSMFLACKAEETPRLLVDVIVVAYEILYSRDPNASQRIKQKAVYEKQKELILIGERVLMTTIGFDLNIQHPYKPLMAALKKLTIPHKEVAKVAWNFVNDWLRTTLCLQYKPHYIAAGSMYLAAKFCKVKLPSERGKVWWLEFDVSPQQLEEVIKRMLKLLEGNNQPQKSASQDKARQAAPVAKTALSSPQSCVLNGCKAPSESSIGIKEKAGVGARSHSSDACLSNSQAVPTEDICSVGNRIVAQCQTSDCGSSQSGIEEGNRNEEVEIQARVEESCQTATCMINPECGGIIRSDSASGSGGLSKIDRDRIREALRKRKYEKAANKKVVDSLDEGKDDDSWIVRELEIGVELGSASGHKRQRC